MKRTISIKLLTTPQQHAMFVELQHLFATACNLIVPVSVANHNYNRVSLHHSVYYKIREQLPQIGSQMVCNSIYSVCKSYKTLVSNNPIYKKQQLPVINFKNTSSVHFDKKTYTLAKDSISLYTLQGRTKVKLNLGQFQESYLEKGIPTEAELILKGNKFYFNLVLDVPEVAKKEVGKVLGVDLGENNLAALSSGKLFGGGKLRYERDKALALRSRLQRKGTQSAKQLLCKISGKESRHVSHVNHVISKQIVNEALATDSSKIVLEDLTNIRKRINAKKKVRSRIHRWAWAELQTFIEYKAIGKGIEVEYVNPAYTSQTCSKCGELGIRNKHKFSCSCGNLAHSDLNASLNLARLGSVLTLSTGQVIVPNVGLSNKAL
jgi:IS605 OrfB family transposase